MKMWCYTATLLLLTLSGVAGQGCPNSWPNNRGVPTHFYPFLTVNDRVVPANDDGTSEEVELIGPFSLFDKRYTSLYVNTNGVLSLGSGVSQYTPDTFPLSGSTLIAPFWADVDTTENPGRVYYRMTTDQQELCRFNNFVNQVLGTRFNANWAFIATWYNVTYFGGDDTTSTNSFQAVIGTEYRGANREQVLSMVLFNYGNIAWTTGTASGGNDQGLGGNAATVGLNDGDGTTSFVINASRTDAIRYIGSDPRTNTGFQGQWLFQVNSRTIVQPSGTPAPPRCDPSSVTISVSPGSGYFMGGTVLTITGPCFDVSAGQLIVRFGNVNVTATIQNEVNATVVTPMYTSRGGVQMWFYSFYSGSWYSYTYTFFYVTSVNSARQVTREGNWQEAPYENLFFTWNTFWFTSGSRINVDFIVFDSIANYYVIPLLVNVVNSGRVQIPDNLRSYSGMLRYNVTGAIRISEYNNANSMYLWSSFHVAEWYLSLVFVEAWNRVSFGHSSITSTDRMVYNWIVWAQQQGFITGNVNSRSIRFLTRRIMSNVVEQNGCAAWSNLQPVQSTEPPPCTVDQAEIDSRWRLEESCDGTAATRCTCDRFFGGADRCYRSDLANSNGGAQRACYDSSGNLITNPMMGAGTPTQFHPDNTINHFISDIAPFYLCCQLSSSTCNDFYRVRQPRGCEGYQPPPQRTANFGDPHFITFDGLSFTFNGIGEYLAMRSVSGYATIQYRLAQVNSNDQFTVITAVSIQVDNPIGFRIQVEVNNARNTMDLYVNGVVPNIPTDVFGQALALSSTAAHTVEWIAESSSSSRSTAECDTPISGSNRAFAAGAARNQMKLTMYDASDPPCIIEVFITKVSSSLTVWVGLSPASCFQNGVYGLLGNFDGNANNDFRYRNGSLLAPNPTARQIHYWYGEHWRTTAAESIFWYQSGFSWSYFQNTFFVPTFLDATALLRLTGEIATICGSNVQCRFDWFVSGNREFAASTFTQVQTWERRTALRQEWQSACYGNPCGPGGTCSVSGSSFQCSCSANYRGTRCETIINICATNPCQNNGQCQTINGGQSYVCYCPSGYAGSRCELFYIPGTPTPCAASPCRNGGSCLADFSRFQYICNCRSPFSGPTCEIGGGGGGGGCASQPCLNGAPCSESEDPWGLGYFCCCRYSSLTFGGRRCQFVDPCRNNPCPAGTAYCVPGFEDTKGRYCYSSTWRPVPEP